MIISPALMIPWIFGRKREPWPEYQSPNTWSKWHTVNNEVLALQDELIKSLDKKQMELYRKYREKILEADREKPWQYSKVEDKT